MTLTAISLKCSNCYGALVPTANSNILRCPFCGSLFETDEPIMMEEIGSSKETESRDPVEVIADLITDNFEKYDYSVQVASWGSMSKEPKIRKRLGIPSIESILMLYDNTVLGSCKQGFALTDAGFHYCFETGSPRFVSWSDFPSLKFKKAKSRELDLIIDGKQYALIGDKLRDKTFDLLTQIQAELA